jgi:hypothetical protein
MTMVLPLHGMAMFLAPFQRRAPAAQPADALDLPEHLFWVLLGRANAFASVLDSRNQSVADLRECAALCRRLASGL